MTIGEELKQHREQLGLSQKDIAKAIDSTQATISRGEKNIQSANINDLVKLADFYEITVDELIGHEVKKNF